MNYSKLSTADLFDLYQKCLTTQSKLFDLKLRTDYAVAKECFYVIRSRMIREKVDALTIDGVSYRPDDHGACFWVLETATPEQLDKGLLFEPSEDLDEVLETAR